MPPSLFATWASFTRRFGPRLGLGLGLRLGLDWSLGLGVALGLGSSWAICAWQGSVDLPKPRDEVDAAREAAAVLREACEAGAELSRLVREHAASRRASLRLDLSATNARLSLLAATPPPPAGEVGSPPEALLCVTSVGASAGGGGGGGGVVASGAAGEDVSETASEFILGRSQTDSSQPASSTITMASSSWSAKKVR